MRPHSMDLQEPEVVALDARKGMRKQIAERFGVSDRRIRELPQRRQRVRWFRSRATRVARGP